MDKVPRYNRNPSQIGMQMDIKNHQQPNIGPEPPYQPPKLPPLTAEDLRSVTLTAVSNETLQFQADVVNVYENRVDIKDFEPAYQKRIKDYYRFSPISAGTIASSIATKNMTREGKG